MTKICYNFNHPDWFSHNIPNWNKLKDLLPGNTCFLEIGSFEGRSTVWIAENFASKTEDVIIDCFDTWSGGEEHSELDMEQVFDTFNHNRELIETNLDNITIFPWRGLSYERLIQFSEFDGQKTCDFIYIDGSHQAADVLTDAVLSWPLLKEGGIMVFDDYHWRPEGFTVEQTPKPAIDAFLTCFKGKFKLIFQGYQVAIQKV